MARKAERELDADWVLNDDADELYWPEGGDDLKAALAKVPHRFGALELPRVNFVARPEAGPVLRPDDAREAESTDAIGRALRPKVAHRANPRMFVSPGSHAVRGAPRYWLTCRKPLITVLHFPRRSYEQYRHKVDIGGATPGYEHKTMVDAHTRAAVRAARGALPRGPINAPSRAWWRTPRLRDLLHSEKWEALLSTHGRPR